MKKADLKVGETYAFAGERYRIRIPKHAVLEYRVEELG